MDRLLDLVNGNFPCNSFCINYNFFRLRDLVGYEIFTGMMKIWGIHRLEGDFIEIGSFVGGGTAKLARAAQMWGKSVYAVDLFEPATDKTVNQAGNAMSTIYDWILGGRSQEEMFFETIKDCGNVHVLKVDSRLLEFPPGQKFSFAFIDGNHDPVVVKSDFSLLWPHMVPGSVMAFHDYGGDLPQTTAAIDEILKEHEQEIARIEKVPEKWIIILFKK